MALCALASRAGFEPVAFTVDHGLRPESSAEADLIQRWLRRRGIAHEVLRIEWPEGPPTSSVQERARDARFAVLGGARFRRALHSVSLITLCQPPVAMLASIGCSSPTTSTTRLKRSSFVCFGTHMASRTASRAHAADLSMA